MSFTITPTLKKLLGATEKITPAKLNQMVAGLTFALGGTAETANIAAGAVTAAKSTPGAYWYATAGGTANAITVDPSPALAAYATGAKVVFKAAATNTGAMTINVNSLGVKDLQIEVGTAIEAGGVLSGAMYEGVYDATADAVLIVSRLVGPQFLTATATLDFGSVAAQNSGDLTITVTGAADGDDVSLGVPNASVNANSCFTAWVSAANTVTVRFNNYSAGAIDPASGSFRVTVRKW